MKMKQERDNTLREGVSLFNEQKFYEAHEAWEAWWLKDKSGERVVFQGLILLAAAFHHQSMGKTVIAKKALVKALARLRGYQGKFIGLNLTLAINNAENCLKDLAKNFFL